MFGCQPELGRIVRSKEIVRGPDLIEVASAILVAVT
jgi:hypothetical protein